MQCPSPSPKCKCKNRHTYQQINPQAQIRVTLQEKYIWKEENSRKANAGGAGSSIKLHVMNNYNDVTAFRYIRSRYPLLQDGLPKGITSRHKVLRDPLLT